MINHSSFQNHESELYKDDSDARVDYLWFGTRFDSLLERLAALENSISAIEQSVSTADHATMQPATREYYSVQEFAAQVERGEYTVREWCRLARIHAEKCETGRGEAKSWKIPVEELGRYRDHGLLPARYTG